MTKTRKLAGVKFFLVLTIGILLLCLSIPLSILLFNLDRGTAVLVYSPLIFCVIWLLKRYQA